MDSRSIVIEYITHTHHVSQKLLTMNRNRKKNRKRRIEIGKKMKYM